MRVITVIFALAFITPFLAVEAQAQAGRNRARAPKPDPTHANVAYGSHDQQRIDLWLAKSDDPTPLVVFIHGGGFRGGSKNTISGNTIKRLLDAGISVAAVEYRFISHAKLPAAHEDCRRALQFLRSRAGEWNLDKDRVGAYGGSAGAQLSMYLAFHDEMADPDSDDPVARESTRLTCVGTNGGQATMDLDWWQKWIPGYNEPHRERSESFHAGSEEEFKKTIAEISALSLLSKDDVPIYMTYGQHPDDPVPDDPKRARGWKVHHVTVGVKLKEKMDALGVEANLVYPRAPKVPYDSMEDFFIEKLSR